MRYCIQDGETNAAIVYPGVETADIEAFFRHARHDRAGEVQRLLQEGVPVNVRDQYGNTALGVAAQNGNKM
jgi:ankyrin repeat protein